MDTTKRYSINNFFKKFFAFLMILFLFFTQNVYAVIDVNNRFLHNSINILSETDYILTINNTSPTDSINANFTHRLPNGVKIADNPNIRNTCGDESNIQTENDGNTGVIKLINGIIPGVNTSKNGTCKIEIKVLGYSSGNKEAIFNEGELTALTNGQNESNTGNSRSNLNVNHLNNIEIYFNYGVKFQKDGEKNIATIEIRRNPENNSNEDLRIDGIEEFGFDIGQQIRIVGGDQDFIKTNTCGLNVRKEENSGISDRFKNQSNEKMTYVKDGYDSLYFSGDLRGNGGSCQITFEYENNFIGPNFTFDKLVNGNDYTITKRSSFSGHGRESINNYFKLKQPSELIDSSLGINRSSNQGNFFIKLRTFGYLLKGIKVDMGLENNDNVIQIIDGEGRKKIFFKFFNGYGENKNINFKHDFPIKKNGTNQMIFERVLTNTCGGNIDGEGTGRMTLTNGIIQGSNQKNYHNHGVESCEIGVQVIVNEEGEYINTLNYKDESLIKGFDQNDDSIHNEHRNSNSYSISFLAERTNGLKINKYLKSVYGEIIGESFLEDKNSKKAYRLYTYGEDTFYTIYELENIVGKKVGVSIKESLNVTKTYQSSDYENFFVKDGEIETTCKGNHSFRTENNNLLVEGLYLDGGEKCYVKIPLRTNKDTLHIFNSNQVYLNKGLRLGDIKTVISGDQNENENSLVIPLTLELSQGLEISKEQNNGIYGKESRSFIEFKNNQKTKEVKELDLLIPLVGQNIKEIDGTVSLLNGNSGVGDFCKDLRFSIEDGKLRAIGKIKNINIEDPIRNSHSSNCRVNLIVDNITKQEFDSLGSEFKTGTEGGIKYWKNNETIIDVGNGKLKYQSGNDNQKYYSYDGWNMSFTLKEDGSELYSRNFSVSEINGGGKTRLNVEIGNKDIYDIQKSNYLIGELNESLKDQGLELHSDHRIEFYCNSRFLDENHFSINENGIQFNGINFKTNLKNRCRMSFDVTSVKGGNIITTGGGDKFISKSGQTLNESSATLLVRRNMNIASGFKKNKIFEGEETEYYIDIFNSQLNDEIGNEFRREFPKNLKFELLENQCGGEINLLEKESGGQSLIMNGQQVSAESKCRIKFKVTGKENGSFTDIIRSGSYTTTSGKSNIDNFNANISIHQDNGIQIIGNQNHIYKGETKSIILRIKRNNKDSINKALNGIMFTLKMYNPDGLTTMVNDHEGIGDELIRQEGLNSRFRSCQNLNSDNRYEINGGNVLRPEEGKLTILPANQSYCDILVHFTGNTTGEKRFYLNSFDYEGKDQNSEVRYDGTYLREENPNQGLGISYLFNVIDKNVIANFIEEGTNTVIKQQETGTSDIDAADIQYYTLVRTERIDNGGEIIINHIYTKKRGKVTINYVGESPSLTGGNSTIETLKTEEFNNLEEGTNFDYTEKKNITFPNYTLDTSLNYDTDLVGTVEGNKTLTIKYNKGIGTIKVKYVEGDGTDNILNENFQEEYSERKLVGDEYDVSGKRLQITGYDLYKSTGQETGTTGNGETIITHYYKKKIIPVTISYIEIEDGNNEVQASPIHNENKKYGDQYNFTDLVNKEIRFLNKTRHELEGINSLEGTIGENPVNIKVYYERKNANITIEFIDEENKQNKIQDDVIKINNKLGKNYQLDSGDTYNIENYNFTRTEGEINGVLENENGIVVKHFYTHKKGTVITKHIDYNTDQELTQSESVTKNIGDSHTALKKNDINGYTFKTIKEGDQETVNILEEKDYVVTYYYVKDNRINLTVNYVDEEGTTISNSEIVKKTKTGYDATNKKKEIENHTFTEIKNGDELSCESIDCLDKDSITLVYTRKKSEITINYKNSDGEIIRTITKILKVGDNYTIDGNDEEIQYYEKLTNGMNMRTGKVPEGNFTIEFTLNKKRGTVKIEHRLNDENGDLLGEELINSFQGENFSFYEGNEENIDRMKEFNEGINKNYYEFIGKQGELTGLIDSDNKKILIFHRKKIGNLNVKYLDVDTNNEISQNINEEKEFGSTYIADQKQIRNYTFVRSQGTTNGIIENDINEVIFYYEKNKGTVLVKFIDKETNNEISERVLIKNKIGERYLINEKEIENYSYENTIGDKEGEIGENQKEVIHVYTRKIGKIVIDILDKETGKLIETKEFSGKVGDGYNLINLIGLISLYNFSDFNGGIENNGIYKDGTTRISVNFIKKKGNVVVKYIDKETSRLIEEVIFEKNVGEEFNPNIKEFEGYSYVEYIGMLNGTVSEDNNENIIEIYYKRGPGLVTVIFTSEDGKKIKDNMEIRGLYGDQYEVKFDVPEGYVFKNVIGELKGKLGYGGEITIIFTKKIESLGSGPGGNYFIKDDNRVKVNEIKISIIDDNKKNEQKEEIKDKKNEITVKEEKKEKEKPIIILGDPIVKKYILDDVREEIEEYKKEQNKIEIKLPKTGVDSDFIKNIEEMISMNNMINEKDKKEIFDKLLDISYDNDISGIQNGLEIILDKENGKTFYKFNGERIIEDQLTGNQVIEEIPVTIVIDTDFNEIDKKDSSFIYGIIGIMIGIILIFGTGFLIIRRKKNH